MAIVKVITNFSKYTFSGLALLAATIIQKLTGNSNFVFTNNELTDVDAKTKTYTQSLKDASTKDMIEVAIKKKAREELEEALSILAYVVNLQGRNDRAKLLTSGIPIAGEKTVSKIQQPEYITIEPTGVPGEFRIKLPKPAYFIHGIVIAICLKKDATDDIRKRDFHISSSLTITISGLPSREEFLVCGSYIGSHNEKEVWSKVETVSSL